MIYSSPHFVVMFAATMAAFLLARRQDARFNILLLASGLFYAWAGVFDAAIFVFVVAVSWAAVRLAAAYPARKHAFLAAGIGVMSAHLFFWKYAVWAVSQVQSFWPGFLWGLQPKIVLPVGISFFTLQGIAYLVDFGRGQAPLMSLRTYLLYKSFFAQLVAGPIVRTHQLLPQLLDLKGPRGGGLSAGLALFMLGFFKKLFIADKLGSLVDLVFAHPSAYTRTTLVLGLLAYTVQIWADFSGYTDMGRGAARMLGIRLPENFLSPYLARSPSEFWRRWHVSLSEWIRDYIYIPLGGSRGNVLRVLGVVVLTMAISGFWHGAQWHFAVWGLYHGALLVLERMTGFGRPSAAAGVWRRLDDTARAATTFVLVVFGWLLFRAESFAAVGAYLSGLLGGAGTQTAPGTFKVYPMLALCLLAQTALYADLETGETPLSRLRVRFGRAFEESAWAGLGAGLALAAVFVGTVLLASSSDNKAFIYFQF